MKIEKLCNLVSTEEFESKDKKKKYHHAIFLADDLTIKCQFIKQADYDILVNLGRLQEVKVEFDMVVNGTDNNSNPTYGLKLDHVIFNVK